jgi:hypothetical protein
MVRRHYPMESSVLFRPLSRLIPDSPNLVEIEHDQDRGESSEQDDSGVVRSPASEVTLIRVRKEQSEHNGHSG